MMMWFCPAVFTTAKTRLKTSCLIREVCNLDCPHMSSHTWKHLQILTFKFFLLLHKHTDGTVRLQREVVLLTDDRNLRVKALTRNVPVRDIPAFLSWAKVGWTRLSWNQRSPTAEACLPLSQGEKTHLSRGRGDGRGEEMIKKAKNHFLWNTSKCSESRVVSLSFPPLVMKCVCVCMC